MPALTLTKISSPKPSLNHSNRSASQSRFISQTTSTQPRGQNDSQTPAQSRRNASQLAPQDAALQTELRALRLPKAVQATYLAPLKRTPTHGIPVCDLQIRSYSVRNLEIFADFCLRAAYYLNLPAKGPVPLPKITERWTVPRSNFVHKKSQENFERVTMRRLIQIQDGHPETVGIWLAYVQKNQYYGVGMKANVFEHGGLSVSEDMEREGQQISERLGEKFDLLGGGPAMERMEEREMDRMLLDEPFKAAWGAYGAMGAAESVRDPQGRFTRVPVDLETREEARVEGKDAFGEGATEDSAQDVEEEK